MVLSLIWNSVARMSFKKAEIARATSASAISAFWKTHKCKLVPYWTRKTVSAFFTDPMIQFIWGGGVFALKQWIISSLKHDTVPRVNNLYCFYVKNPPKRVALWGRENSQWLLTNSTLINMKKFTWRKCQEISLEAIFFLLRENVFHSFQSILNFRRQFMWYHWLRKFPILFQEITI